jgi:glycosyltransferase involved in cell wall biosynthesis
MAPEYETLLIGGEKDESEASSDFIVKSLDLHPKIISGMRRSINPMNDYRAYKEIRKIIRDFKPDIVHTHASKAGALGRLAAIHEKVPVIVHTFHGHVFHSYFGALKTSVFKFIERYLAKKSSAIVAISEEQKRELTLEHGICDPEKTHVIPLGFDLDRFAQNKEHKRTEFRSKWGIKESEIVVAIVGRLVPVKNHKMFIDAMATLLQTEGLRFRALIVGDGELRAELENYATEKKIPFTSQSGSSPLLFTSWIKDVDQVLAASDIIALTSWNEGTPVSLIEAHAASCPVVTTNVGGVESIVKHGETGFLSEPGDSAAFAASLKLLIQDEKQRNKMASAASSRVMQKFHYMRLISDMKALYTQFSQRIG